jgi:hypothetical protein
MSFQIGETVTVHRLEEAQHHFPYRITGEL